ncbi:MAG TPA: TonB family protein [Stellaceae bacterium]
MQETKAQPKEDNPPVELPSPAPQPEAEKPQPALPPPPPEVQPAAVLPAAPPEKPAVPPRKVSPIAPRSQPKPGLRLDVTGAREHQEARRLTQEELERALLQDYVNNQLSKRIEANLLYPAEARKAGLAGTATVGFDILADGQIDGASLRIVTSSGQPLLDQSALDTVRASVPLPPPPQPISLTIGIVFRP